MKNVCDATGMTRNKQEFIINIYEPFMYIREYSRGAAGKKIPVGHSAQRTTTFMVRCPASPSTVMTYDPRLSWKATLRPQSSAS